MNFLRSYRQFLAGGSKSRPTSSFRDLSLNFNRSVVALQVFYIFVLYTAVLNFDVWRQHLEGPPLIPLWPLFWVEYFPQNPAIFCILFFHVIGAVLGVFFCRYRSIRIIVFLGLLEYVALRGSYGKIGHSFHLLTLTSFLLIFLPSGWNSGNIIEKAIKLKTLLVFTACQFLIMFSYTMSGLGKVGMACYQLVTGQIFAFHPRALSLHIAQRLLETGDRSILGPWLIDHSLYAWPMMQATLYLQLFAVFVVLRPSLHKPWAAGLILFHIFSFFILTINFPANCFLLGLFFLVGASQPTSLRQMLADLPLFGMVFRRMCSKSA